jgi:hypothetical protein
MTKRVGLEVDTLTVRIPMRLQRRGGRKLIMTPGGVAAPARKSSRDETLVQALVRAHRWRRRIETGQARSITDLAEQEGATDAYVRRLLPLTCLAPDIVDAILDGRQPKGLRLAEVLVNGPVAWEEQVLGGSTGEPAGAVVTPHLTKRSSQKSSSAEREPRAGSTVASQQVEWKRPATRCFSASSL